MPVRFSYPRSFALALCSLSLVPSAVSADSLPWTKRKKPAVYSPSDYKAPADAYANGAYSPVDAPADYSGNSSSDPYADPAANAPADNVIVRRLPKSTLPSAGNSSYAAATPDYSGAGAVYDDPADNDGSAGANYGDSNRGTYRMSEISAAGRNFFGGVSENLASVIEHAFRQSGEPNGYILGEEAGGAFIAGLRYGEGTLYTKNAGTERVFWQGPSIGYDFGAEGSKTMVLVYNLRRTTDIFAEFGGVSGSAYLVGGVGITYLTDGHVIAAPIRSGVGLRLGANVGYLKYTSRPTWNPF